MNKKKKNKSGLNEIRFEIYRHRNRECEYHCRHQNEPIISENTASLILNGFHRELNTSSEEVGMQQKKKRNWHSSFGEISFKVPLQYESTMMISIVLQLNTLLSNLLMPILNIFLIKKSNDVSDKYRRLKLHYWTF